MFEYLAASNNLHHGAYLLTSGAADHIDQKHVTSPFPARKPPPEDLRQVSAHRSEVVAWIWPCDAHGLDVRGEMASGR